MTAASASVVVVSAKGDSGDEEDWLCWRPLDMVKKKRKKRRKKRRERGSRCNNDKYSGTIGTVEMNGATMGMGIGMMAPGTMTREKVKLAADAAVTVAATAAGQVTITRATFVASSESCATVAASNRKRCERLKKCHLIELGRPTPSARSKLPLDFVGERQREKKRVNEVKQRVKFSPTRRRQQVRQLNNIAGATASHCGGGVSCCDSKLVQNSMTTEPASTTAVNAPATIETSNMKIMSKRDAGKEMLARKCQMSRLHTVGHECRRPSQRHLHKHRHHHHCHCHGLTQSVGGKCQGDLKHTDQAEQEQEQKTVKRLIAAARRQTNQTSGPDGENLHHSNNENQNENDSNNNWISTSNSGVILDCFIGGLPDAQDKTGQAMQDDDDDKQLVGRLLEGRQRHDQSSGQAEMAEQEVKLSVVEQRDCCHPPDSTIMPMHRPMPVPISEFTCPASEEKKDHDNDDDTDEKEEEDFDALVLDDSREADVSEQATISEAVKVNTSSAQVAQAQAELKQRKSCGVDGCGARRDQWANVIKTGGGGRWRSGELELEHAPIGVESFKRPIAGVSSRLSNGINYTRGKLIGSSKPNMRPTWRQALGLAIGICLLTSLLALLNISVLTKKHPLLSSSPSNSLTISAAAAATNSDQRPKLAPAFLARDKNKQLIAEPPLFETMTTEQTTATLSAPISRQQQQQSREQFGATEMGNKASQTIATATTTTGRSVGGPSEAAPTTVQPPTNSQLSANLQQQQQQQQKPKKLANLQHNQHAISSSNWNQSAPFGEQQHNQRHTDRQAAEGRNYAYNSNKTNGLQMGQSKWQAIVPSSEVAITTSTSLPLLRNQELNRQEQRHQPKKYSSPTTATNSMTSADSNNSNNIKDDNNIVAGRTKPKQFVEADVYRNRARDESVTASSLERNDERKNSSPSDISSSQMAEKQQQKQQLEQARTISIISSQQGDTSGSATPAQTGLKHNDAAQSPITSSSSTLSSHKPAAASDKSRNRDAEAQPPTFGQLAPPTPGPQLAETGWTIDATALSNLPEMSLSWTDKLYGANNYNNYGNNETELGASKFAKMHTLQVGGGGDRSNNYNYSPSQVQPFAAGKSALNRSDNNDHNSMPKYSLISNNNDEWEQERQQQRQLRVNLAQSDISLEGALKEALDDLVTSAAGEPLLAAPSADTNNNNNANNNGAEKQQQQQQLQAVARKNSNLAPNSLFSSLLVPNNGASLAAAVQLPQLDLRHFRQTLLPNRLVNVPPPSQSAQSAKAAPQANLQLTSSQSAPSISLPPISHFLTPRNPFKLFASASTPISTRYWPHKLSTGSGGHKQQHHNQNQQQQQQSTSSHSSRHPSLLPRRWFGSSSISTHANTENYQKQQHHHHSQPMSMAESGGGGHLSLQSTGPPFGQGPSSAPMSGLDLLSLQDLMSPTMMSAASSTAPRLYAHSHTAEQLEKLVRAASQAGHLRGSPPILPAIVSGPNGQTFPGFYIPAIEPLEGNNGGGSGGGSGGISGQQQESQISELIRHHDGSASSPSASMSSVSDSSGGDLLSTIPGTDYILHPDEVRAMVDIGESAWQNNQKQQQQQQQYRNQPSSAASSLHQQKVHQVGAGREHRDFMFKSLDGEQQQQHNLMQENHLENLRNYAYVDAGNLANFGQRENLQVASSAGQEQQLGSPHANHSTSSLLQQQQQLGVQLNRALMRSRSRNLPAIIRVNDQDYIHWPLIQMQPVSSSMSQQQQQQYPHHQNRQQSQQQQQQQASSSQLQMSKLTPVPDSSQHQRPAPSGGGTGLQPDQRSPVQLATQLTPAEIRQVEDSILETLIMAQTIQHQRKIMDAMAAASGQQHQQLARPSGFNGNFNMNNNQGSSKRRQPMGAAGQRYRGQGFFSRRRRRRNSSSKGNNKAASPQQSADEAEVQQQQQQSMQSSPSTMVPLGQQQARFVGMMPILAATPVRFYQMLAPPVMPPRPMLHPMLASFSRVPDEELSRHEFNGGGAKSVGSPDERQAAGESKVSARYPPIMADQETNKPSSTPSAPATSSSAQKEGAATELTASASTTTRLQTDASEVFGSRVRSGHSRSGNVGEQQRAANVTTPSSNGAGRSSQYVTFVPILNNRHKQISLYHGQAQVSGDPSSVPGASASFARPDRINVDWPAMTSDADYFPDSNQHKAAPTPPPHRPSVAANGLQPIVAGQSNSLAPAQAAQQQTHYDGRQVSPGLAAQNGDEGDDDDQNDDDGPDDDRDQRQTRAQRKLARSERQRQLAAANAGNMLTSGAATTMSVIQPQSTRRGTFLTSQMKLQFAQDYQDREGVPLYNNNVRVAGALDRQRSAEAAAAAAAGGSGGRERDSDESASDADESRLVAKRMERAKASGSTDGVQQQQQH